MTITDLCANPKFGALLKRAHADYWASGERQNMSAEEISRGILRMLCDVKTDDEVSASHPEIRALVEHLGREGVLVADLHHTQN